MGRIRSVEEDRSKAKKVTLSHFEQELFESFGSFAAKEIRMCERAATYVGAIIQRQGPGPIRSDPDEELNPKQLRLGAMLGIAIRTLRAMRASLAVLSVGYETEAAVYDRLLIELRGRMAQVANDPTGEMARRWLAGEAPTRISRLWSDETMKSLYASLSTAVHADSRTFGHLLEPSLDTIFIGPKRTALTRASLIAQCVVAYEIIVTLSKETDVKIEGIQDLLVEIAEASVALKADFENLRSADAK
jgi:hypothetical protein